MDATSFIIFLLLATAGGAAVTRLWLLAQRVARLEAQVGRFLSDIESEKGTRKRINHDIVNRLRILEGQRPLPSYDSPTDQA